MNPLLPAVLFKRAGHATRDHFNMSRLTAPETGAMNLVSVTGELLSQYKCPMGCEGGFIEGLC